MPDSYCLTFSTQLKDPRHGDITDCIFFIHPSFCVGALLKRVLRDEKEHGVFPLIHGDQKV